MKCVHFAVHVRMCESQPHSLMYTAYLHHVTSQPNSGIVTVAIQLKVLTMFEAQEMSYVDVRAKNLRNVCTQLYMYACVKASFSHVHCMPPPSHQSTKLRIVTVAIQLKVLTMFEAQEMSYVDVKELKTYECVHFATLCYTCMYKRVKSSFSHACTLHTSTKSPVNQTQDYDCCHLVKGIDNV